MTHPRYLMDREVRWVNDWWGKCRTGSGVWKKMHCIWSMMPLGHQVSDLSPERRLGNHKEVETEKSSNSWRAFILDVSFSVATFHKSETQANFCYRLKNSFLLWELTIKSWNLIKLVSRQYIVLFIKYQMIDFFPFTCSTQFTLVSVLDEPFFLYSNI
jgi:hypothetical protein